jgi:hypothetical protein
MGGLRLGMTQSSSLAQHAGVPVVSQLPVTDLRGPIAICSELLEAQQEQPVNNDSGGSASDK